jgi:hypothetical protein
MASYRNTILGLFCVLQGNGYVHCLKLKSCHDISAEEMSICKTGQVYKNNAPPEPLPTKLSSMVYITDILDVNTEANSMTIIADIIVSWNDSALSLHGGNDSK